MSQPVLKTFENNALIWFRIWYYQYFNVYTYMHNNSYGVCHINGSWVILKGWTVVIYIYIYIYIYKVSLFFLCVHVFVRQLSMFWEACALSINMCILQYSQRVICAETVCFCEPIYLSTCQRATLVGKSHVRKVHKDHWHIYSLKNCILLSSVFREIFNTPALNCNKC